MPFLYKTVGDVGTQLTDETFADPSNSDCYYEIDRSWMERNGISYVTRDGLSYYADKSGKRISRDNIKVIHICLKGTGSGTGVDGMNKVGNAGTVNPYQYTPPSSDTPPVVDPRQFIPVLDSAPVVTNKLPVLRKMQAWDGTSGGRGIADTSNVTSKLVLSKSSAKQEDDKLPPGVLFETLFIDHNSGRYLGELNKKVYKDTEQLAKITFPNLKVNIRRIESSAFQNLNREPDHIYEGDLETIGPSIKADLKVIEEKFRKMVEYEHQNQKDKNIVEDSLVIIYDRPGEVFRSVVFPDKINTATTAYSVNFYVAHYITQVYDKPTSDNGESALPSYLIKATRAAKPPLEKGDFIYEDADRLFALIEKGAKEEKPDETVQLKIDILKAAKEQRFYAIASSHTHPDLSEGMSADDIGKMKFRRETKTASHSQTDFESSKTGAQLPQVIVIFDDSDRVKSIEIITMEATIMGKYIKAASTLEDFIAKLDYHLLNNIIKKYKYR